MTGKWKKIKKIFEASKVKEENFIDIKYKTI